MAKPSESSSAQLAATQEKLKRAHAKLVTEFEKLHQGKFSAASHREYLEKLKTHLHALEEHTAAIRAQHDALHQQRATLHERHEAEAPALKPAPPKRRTSRGR